MVNFLVIFIVTCSFQVALTTDKLGLIHKIRELTVSTEKEIQEVGVYFPIRHTIEDYSGPFATLKEKVQKITSIPGLQNGTDNHSTVSHILADITHKQRIIEAIHKVLLTYRSTESRQTISIKCYIEFIEFTPTTLKNIITELNSATKTLNFDADNNHFKTNAAELVTTIEILNTVRRILNNYYLVLSERVSLLESLSNGIADGEALAPLQFKDCVKDGQIEKTTTRQCEKLRDSFLCILETQVFSKPNLVDYYAPINYQGIQINFGHNNQYLIKSADKGWAILTCISDSDRQLDSFDSCTLSDYQNDCSNSFISTNIDKYINHCNFTTAEPPLTMTTDNGVLIQGENVVIQLKDTGTNQMISVTEKTPVIIRTTKPVQVQKGTQTINWKTNTAVESEAFVASWLSQADIDRIQSTVQKQEILEELDVDSIIDLVLIIVILIIVPVVGYTAKGQMYKTRDWLKQAEEYQLKNKHMQNLRDNNKLKKLRV
jgi:hypothetical protein